jgi:hypothetical protein
MNCRKYEMSINDLARGLLMDAATKREARAHAEGCERCAARLADERALTEGLRALAASQAKHDAPAHLEAALLTAFRQHDHNEERPVEIAPAMSQAKRRLYWAIGAAAAAILFVVALSVARLPLKKTDAGTARKTEPSSPTPSPRREEATAPSPVIAEDDSLEEQATPGPKYRFASNKLPASSRRTRPGNGTAANRLAATDAVSNPNNSEIVTDFLPLTYDAGTLAMESGHVVRVELPRSALVSMGLPMNMERANEPVKADVLLGDDGVARAIRFVR